MIAFEVLVNGTRLCVAGIGESGVLTSMVVFAAGQRLVDESSSAEERGTKHLRIGGWKKTADDSSRQCEWLKRTLSVGDEVVLRILEVDTVDEPSQVHEEQPRACSFCGAKSKHSGDLIAGAEVRICHACLVRLSGADHEDMARVAAAAGDVRCSFCYKTASVTSIAFASAEAAICARCLLLCHSISQRLRAGSERPPPN